MMAVLACISMTAHAAELWVNDIPSGIFTRSGTDAVYANGSYSGTYLSLGGIVYAANDVTNVQTSGTFILLGSGGATTYRPFDGGAFIAINDLQYHVDEGIGDSLSLKFTAAAQVVGAGRFSFGFLGANDDPLFVSYGGSSTDSTLRYRAGSRIMGQGMGISLSDTGSTWKDSLFNDLLTHDLDLTIAATANGYQLTLTISANGEQSPTSISRTIDATSGVGSTWLGSLGDTDITGIGFRTENARFIINDVQVLYTTIPEPSALALLGIGMFPLIILKFRDFMRAAVFKL
jgi:hypothetical protein